VAERTSLKTERTVSNGNVERAGIYTEKGGKNMAEGIRYITKSQPRPESKKDLIKIRQRASE